MGGQIDYQLDIVRYSGPKKLEMPIQFKKTYQSTWLPCAYGGVTRAGILADVTSRDDCPEFSGYITHLCCKQGQSYQPKTKPVYLPLIDMLFPPPPPASENPDTIITVMIKAQKLTEETGKGISTLFTADQLIYWVVVEVQWVYHHPFPQTNS